MFYGEPSEYCIIALLPSYMERGNSSLVYMVKSLINLSKHPDSNFYLSDLDLLTKKLIQLDKSGQKTILFGVSFALLDLFERSKMDLRNTIIIETGGMKGRRKELTREELHNYLKVRSGCTQIHSEYGMTELLSQAYSQSDGEFIPPPWMKILIRDPYDPFTLLSGIKTGGLNVIDLANLNSCAFIETSDLGRILPNGKFEVLGRFDNSELRGCNLMIQ